MTRQIFAITRVFHPQRRDESPTAHQYTIQSSSEAQEPCSVTSQMLQLSTYLSEPSTESRAGKIARLRRAVESGTYCVSAEQIAEKIAQEILANMFT